jgi:hypothetical protein
MAWQLHAEIQIIAAAEKIAFAIFDHRRTYIASIKCDTS